MLCFDRINGSEGVDLAKINKSKECTSYYYWFFNHDHVCNGFHNLTMLCLNISYITIITVKNVYYSCIIHNISKSEAINLLKNAVFEDCQEYI